MVEIKGVLDRLLPPSTGLSRLLPYSGSLTGFMRCPGMPD